VTFDGKVFQMASTRFITLPPCALDPDACRPQVTAAAAEIRVHDKERIESGPLVIDPVLGHGGRLYWHVRRPGEWCPIASVNALDGSYGNPGCLGE
jgi:hypothetical protein